ncbi:VOC family protein [Aquimarina sp. 2201CG5-10]|uniref:VOC family protein n=1 Tax=Aquimarina callyspongiae TaxID=3098150 RepID=UPI002AB42890|nr:VOC family protein [Aquimarina sp. 2201CG5-10]MDY8135393.1 VOC family protein [Aquimarina sp. 2201CG5-10]
MKRTVFILSTAIAIFCFTACNNKNNSELEKQKIDETLNQSTEKMKSYVSIFEIPATDISRAIKFYQAILNINIEKMEMSGLEMGIFPYEDQTVTGVIMKGEGFQPSANGVTLYLNGGDNLQVILDKVEKNGGKIKIPKTPHADESGYFAIFLDSEGNKMGLHSLN